MAKVADIHVGIGAKTEELDRGLDKAKGSLKSFANSAKMALGAVGLGMGLREVGQTAIEASKLAGKVEDVENAFNRLNRPDLLDKMKQATQGAVDNLNLMQQAIMADNFRIPLDVMAKGLEFATIRAKETGQEVDYLVNSFVIGMGRKSIMILDNLGLSMREIQEETKKTGDFATAVGNIMDRELAKAGKQGVSTSVAYGQLNAEMKNLKANAGAIINVLFKVNEEL